MNRESASQFRSKAAAENVRTWQRCRTGAMEPGGLYVERVRYRFRGDER